MRWAGWSIRALFRLGAFAPPPANNLYVALVLGVLAGLVFNFTLSKKLVFKGRSRFWSHFPENRSHFSWKSSTVTDLITAKAGNARLKIQALDRRGRDAGHRLDRAAAHDHFRPHAVRRAIR